LQKDAASGEGGFVIVNDKKPQAPQVVEALRKGVDRDKIVISSRSLLEYRSDSEDSSGDDGGSVGEEGMAFDADQVVSVLLPVKKGDAEQEGVLTPLRHLYVVTMKPAERFLAYECALSGPVFV
jgi:hypothetical protein